ncbi:MAG: glycosyltransferase [Chloroflexi bacterium]|nr:glycosyltransferase [Chloroflexota bacterium]OJV90188.1 MAG: hypothetical protein BGO39_02155 [Chloroflexi bacterium 54-19]
MSPENPQVSVLITTYNETQYIREAIQGVLDQTFTGYELLIINHGPADNTGEIVREFKDERLIYRFDRDQSSGFALNTLLKLARGKFVCFAGANDISHPDRLERQYNFLVETGGKGAFAGLEFTGEVYRPLQIVTKSADYTTLTAATQAEMFSLLFFNQFNENFFPVETAMFERQALLEAGLFSNTFVQLAPQAMWLKLLKKIPLAVMPEKLVNRLDDFYHVKNSVTKETLATQTMFEAVQIRREVLADIPVDFFKEAFAGQLRRPDFQEGPEFELEKVFIYFKHLLQPVRAVGREKLSLLLQDPAMLAVAQEHYQFGLSEFFALCASQNLSSMIETIALREWGVNLHLTYNTLREEYIKLENNYLGLEKGYNVLESQYALLQERHNDLETEHAKINKWAKSLENKYLLAEDLSRNLEAEYLKLKKRTPTLPKGSSTGNLASLEAELHQANSRLARQIEANRELEQTLARFEKDLRQLQATRTVRLAGFTAKTLRKIVTSKYNPLRPNRKSGQDSV